MATTSGWGYSGKPSGSGYASYQQLAAPKPAGTTGGVQASYGNAFDLYAQYGNAIANQPQPANLSRYSTAGMYQQAMPAMRADYATLADYIAQLNALYDPTADDAYYAQLMDMANKAEEGYVAPRRNQLFYGYGY